MSFAAKPFSAAGPQSASSQRAGMSTRSWALQQRRLVPGRDASGVSTGGARLSGWSGESDLHRIQPEFTFEFWSAPSSRRRLTTVSQTATPAEAALALVLLPVGGFACHCSSGTDVQAQDSAHPSVEAAPAKETSPVPSSTGSSTDAADEEVETALVQTNSRLSTPQLKQQQSQWQRPPSPLTATPAPSLPPMRRQQQRPLNRSLSAAPSDQLLKLVRLSYTHSDLATRRLLKSSLLHRSRPDPSSVTVTAARATEIADSGNVSGRSNDSSRAVSSTTTSGLLTRRRFPMPTPIGMRASGEQPPLRLWSRDQCLSLPPLVPNS